MNEKETGAESMTSDTSSSFGSKVLPTGVDAYLAAKERELDEFERGCALPGSPPIEVENEAKRLLSLRPGELRSLNAEGCGEASFTLTQFAFFLQKALNKEMARINLATEARDKLVCNELDKYKGWKYEERLKKAVWNNAATAAWEIIRVQASLRRDRIAYLEGKVTDMANTLLGLQSTKRGQK